MSLCPYCIIMATEKHKSNAAEKRAKVQLIMAICLVVFGCILITAAFLIPPTAEIHPSVLTAFGEILSFAGAVIGIDYSYKKIELREWYKQQNKDNEEDA